MALIKESHVYGVMRTYKGIKKEWRPTHEGINFSEVYALGVLSLSMTVFARLNPGIYF